MMFPYQKPYKQKQIKITKSLANFSALLNETDIHGDDDDIFGQRDSTREDLDYIQSELGKSTDYQSKFKMPNFF